MTVIRSPIRSPIFSPIRTPTTLYKGGGLPWYPNRLFQSGDILLWYDPSDLTTMFKDTAGTQPVTADGDSVALMLDKGQWGGKTLEQVLAAQPEILANSTFDAGVANWNNAATTISADSGTLRTVGGGVGTVLSV